MDTVLSAESSTTAIPLNPLWIALIAFLGILLFECWIKRDARGFLKRRQNQDAEPSPPSAAPAGSDSTDSLYTIARQTVEETIAALPGPIRKEAESVPWQLMDRGDDPDLLGLFTGFEEDRLSEGGRICLYLLTIADYCRDEGIPFADEVRTTYLHELGHHLGWDEDDLEARNL